MFNVVPLQPAVKEGLATGFQWHRSYFQGMDNDFTKRGYLLPEGCKDLIDVLNKHKKEWQHAELVVDLQRLQKVLVVEFKARKPFWKPPA